MSVIPAPPVTNDVRLTEFLFWVYNTLNGVTTGGSGYSTVEDEGVALAQRTTINFIGAGVTASDSGSKTTVTIPGGGTGPAGAQGQAVFLTAEQGEDGEMGAPGPQGIAGATGPQGQVGPAVIFITESEDGERGPPGPVGVQGPAGGGGGGTTGTAMLDFGVFPGSSDTSFAVTGQAGILADSIVQAWLRPVDTSDHSADEHIVETLSVFAGNIVAGTGFTIYGANTSQLNEPLERVGRSVGGARGPGDVLGSRGGMGTRIYGQWSVSWRWS